MEAQHRVVGVVGGPTTAAAAGVAHREDPAEVVPTAAGDYVAEKNS